MASLKTDTYSLEHFQIQFSHGMQKKAKKTIIVFA